MQSPATHAGSGGGGAWNDAHMATHIRVLFQSRAHLKEWLMHWRTPVALHKERHRQTLYKLLTLEPRSMWWEPPENWVQHHAQHASRVAAPTLFHAWHHYAHALLVTELAHEAKRPAADTSYALYKDDTGLSTARCQTLLYLLWLEFHPHVSNKQVNASFAVSHDHVRHVLQRALRQLGLVLEHDACEKRLVLVFSPLDSAGRNQARVGRCVNAEQWKQYIQGIHNHHVQDFLVLWFLMALYNQPDMFRATQDFVDSDPSYVDWPTLAQDHPELFAVREQCTGYMNITL
jgi:hypothetical protein